MHSCISAKFFSVKGAKPHFVDFLQIVEYIRAMAERSYSRRRVLGAGLVAGAMASRLLPDLARGQRFELTDEETYLGQLQEEFPFQEQVRLAAQTCTESCGEEKFWGSMAFAQSSDGKPKFRIFLPQLANDEKKKIVIPGLAKKDPEPAPVAVITPVSERPKWPREVLLSPVFKGPSDRPLVGLTIDDGYFARDEILATLVDKKVSATLFIIGIVREMYRDFIVRAKETGRTEEANHSFTHTDLTKKTWSQIANDELGRSEDSLGSIDQETTLPYARPYGGIRNTFVDSAFADRGFRPILWNVSGDAGNYTANQLVELYLSQLDRMANPWGSIILLHFRTETARALPYIIDGIRVRGMEPVKLGRLYEGGRV